MHMYMSTQSVGRPRKKADYDRLLVRLLEADVIT